MPTYTITRGEDKFEVKAETEAEAAVKVDQAIQMDAEEKAKVAASPQGQMNAQYQQEGEEAPWYKQPFMAAMDVGKVMGNAATADWMDPGIKALTGWDSAADTTARKSRMGFAAPAAEMVTAARLPTAIPSAIKAGGKLLGPMGKIIGGGVTAGAEGATYGGLQAAAKDQDVEEGAVIGGAGGALGQGVASSRLAGKLAKPFLKDDMPPKYALSKLPKKPTAMDYVNHAATKSESKAAAVDDPVQKQQVARNVFENLQTGDPKKLMNPEQREQVGNIVKGDALTKLYRALSTTLSNNTISTGAGIATGGLAGVAAATGVKGAGGLFGKMSNNRTQDAIQDLRRMVYKIPKSQLSVKAKSQFGRALREMGSNFIDAAKDEDED